MRRSRLVGSIPAPWSTSDSTSSRSSPSSSPSGSASSWDPTVVNGAIVDRLDREIDHVRKESDNLREANRQANSELDRANEFLDDSAAYAVDGRLTDVPVVVHRRTRRRATTWSNDTAQLVIAAGAECPAVFWLEERWKLETEEDVQALRDAADLLGGASSVRTRALGELAARLTEPVDAAGRRRERTDRPRRPPRRSRLPRHRRRQRRPRRRSRRGRRAPLVVTGTNSQFAGTDMTVETVSAFVDADAPTVVGEVFVREDAADAPERGAAVAPVRTNDGLSAMVVDGRRSRPGRRAGRDRASPCRTSERRRRSLRLRGRRDEQPAAAARRAMTPRALRRGRTAPETQPTEHEAPWTRAAARMGAVTAVSRGFGFVRVLVIAAVLGTTYPRQRVPGRELGVERRCSSSSRRARCRRCWCRRSSSCSTRVTTTKRTGSRPDCSGSRSSGSASSLSSASSAHRCSRALLTAGVENDAVAAEQRALETYLLRWFLPQLLLYACGAIATGVLYARRRFAITAAAPIGNTIVMVAALIAFRIVAGPDPTLVLSSTERLLLVIAGTGGVIAFVGDPGRRGPPQRLLAATALEPARDPEHPQAACGSRHGACCCTPTPGSCSAPRSSSASSVAGGVVAYQVAFVFFLAPYAVLAQPILTAFLPDLVGDAERGDMGSFAATVRGALDRMAVLVLPVSAVMIALALPDDARRRVRRTPRAPASSCSPPRSRRSRSACSRTARSCCFRASYYALGDSRTPALRRDRLCGGGCRRHGGRCVAHQRCRARRRVGHRPHGRVLRRRARARLRRAPPRRDARLGRRAGPRGRCRRRGGRRGLARRPGHRPARSARVTRHARRRRCRGARGVPRRARVSPGCPW